MTAAKRLQTFIQLIRKLVKPSASIAFLTVLRFFEPADGTV